MLHIYVCMEQLAVAAQMLCNKTPLQGRLALVLCDKGLELWKSNRLPRLRCRAEQLKGNSALLSVLQKYDQIDSEVAFAEQLLIGASSVKDRFRSLGH